jgi:hypothetical protein
VPALLVPFAVAVAVSAGASGAGRTEGPILRSFTPTSGTVGSTVTIRGGGFSEASAPGGKVTFHSNVGASFTVVSDTTVTATVPGDAQYGPISLTTHLGTATSGSRFFKVVPTITGFTPTTGPVGTEVTINGTGLMGASLVRFGRFDATITSKSGSYVKAKVPPGAITAPIQVLVDGGRSASTSPAKFVVGGPPEITMVHSAGNPRGCPSAIAVSAKVGGRVYIFGSGLKGATAVTFAAHAEALFYAPLGGNTISTHVPADARYGPIAVTTPGGTARSEPFGIVPTVSSFSPPRGRPGTLVTIRGTGFEGAPAVLFGSTGSTVVSRTSTILKANVPRGMATGPVKITVTVDGGCSTLSSRSFQVLPPLGNNGKPKP